MTCYDIFLFVIYFIIFFGVQSCGHGMMKSVKAFVLGRVMPVVEKKIVQKCTADQAPLVCIQFKMPVYQITESCHPDAVVKGGDAAVLYKALHQKSLFCTDKRI